MVIGFKSSPPSLGDSIQGGGSYGQFLSQSIGGGGGYGVFGSQSIQGGGSVSGVSVGVGSTGFNPNHASSVGFFVKAASLPASDMTLVDLNFAPNGYFRFKLASNGHIISEGAYRGVARTADSGVAISAGPWYWVSGIIGGFSGTHNQYWVSVNVYNSGGILVGTANQGWDFGNETRDVYTATLGWGVSQSTGYLNFPNSAGNELSKLYLHNDSDSAGGPPGSDMSTSGLEALYLCRGTVGSSVCNDSTTGVHHLTAGPNGMTVQADGPYP